MSFDIHIRVIDDAEHRYPFSGGDWFWDEQGALQIRISHLSDWRHEACLAIHELVEALLCKYAYVPQIVVDAFDAEYDRTHASDLNAGDDPEAPYKKQHCYATAVERMLVAALDLDWKRYDDELAAIPSPQEKPHGQPSSDH